MMLKVISFILTLYLYILQIPLTTLLLQGYLCDESPDELLVISNLNCSSLTHKILTITSTFMLIVYVLFMFFEQ